MNNFNTINTMEAIFIYAFICVHCMATNPFVKEQPQSRQVDGRKEYVLSSGERTSDRSKAESDAERLKASISRTNRLSRSSSGSSSSGSSSSGSSSRSSTTPISQTIIEAQTEAAEKETFTQNLRETTQGRALINRFGSTQGQSIQYVDEGGKTRRGYLLSSGSFVEADKRYVQDAFGKLYATGNQNIDEKQLSESGFRVVSAKQLASEDKGTFRDVSNEQLVREFEIMEQEKAGPTKKELRNLRRSQRRQSIQSLGETLVGGGARIIFDLAQPISDRIVTKGAYSGVDRQQMAANLFGSGSAGDLFLSQEYTERKQAAAAIYSLPFFFSAPSGKALSALNKARALPGIAQIGGAVSKVPVGARFVGGSVAKAIVLPSAAQGISTITAPKELREARKVEGFKQDVFTARQEQLKSLSGKGGIYSFLYQNVPFTADIADRGAFEDTLRELGKQRGLSGSRLNNYVQAGLRARSAGNYGEIAALLSISAGSEGYGRYAVRQSFAKGRNLGAQGVGGFFRSFLATAPGIARAGFVEGASQEIAQQTARFDTRGFLPAPKTRVVDIINPLSTKDVGRGAEILRMGGFGAFTAGLLGGTIASKPLAKRGGSKAVITALEYGSYLTDPFEKPGDLIQDLFETVNVRRGRTVYSPALTQTNGKFRTTVISRTQSPTKTQTNLNEFFGNARVSNNILASIFPNTRTQTKTQTKTNIGSRVNTLLNIFTNTPATVPTQISDIANVPTDTQTQTETTTQTPVSIFSNVPTVTTLPRIFPPLPLLPGLQGGSGNGSKKKARRTFNELRVGQNILKNLVGF